MMQLNSLDRASQEVSAALEEYKAWASIDGRLTADERKAKLAAYRRLEAARRAREKVKMFDFGLQGGMNLDQFLARPTAVYRNGDADDE